MSNLGYLNFDGSTANIESEQPSILDEMLGFGVDANTQDAVDLLRLKKKFDLPETEVANALPELRKQEKVESINPVDIKKNYPSIERAFINNPTLAEIYTDSIEQLKELEDSAKGDSKPSFNAVRNIGKRITTLAGNTIGAVDTATNSIEEILQKGNMGLGEITYRPPQTLLETFTLSNFGYRSGAEAKALKKQGKYPERLSQSFEKNAEKLDFGYEATHTWETTKQRFKDDGALSAGAWGELLNYSVETGGASLVDMGAMVFSLPTYIISRTKEMGDERAKNKGLKETTTQEMLEASPFVVGSVLLDRLSMLKMFGKGNAPSAEELGKEALESTYKYVLKETGKRTGFEMTTEAVQEGLIEYVGEKWGTDAKMSVIEGLDRGLGGAVAAGPMAGTITGVTTTLEARRHNAVLRKSIEAKEINKQYKSATDQDKLDNDTALMQSLMEKSPEGYQEYYKILKEDYPDMTSSVHIEARDLKEAIKNGEIDNPETQKFYTEMLEDLPLNEDIEIPMEEYVAVFSENNTFRENVRLSADGMSILDIKNAEPAMNAITAKIVKEAQLNEAEHAKSVGVYESIKDQLYDTGRLNSREAKLSASLMPALMQRHAVERGITIQEAYESIPNVSINQSESNTESSPEILTQATEQGYEGDNQGEAQEWLSAKAKGLDMSQEARMSRAKEQGFDTENTFYHGTDKEFEGFSKDKIGERFENYSFGIYFASDAKDANAYTKESNVELDNANVKPVRLKYENPLRVEVDGIDPSMEIDIDRSKYIKQILESRKTDNPYDALIVTDKKKGNSVVVAFEPNQVRSVNAAFDPDHSDSANLLAQSEKGVKSEGVSLGQENRASIQRTNEEFIINLGKQSDRSSFLHESGHMFLDIERIFAEKFGVSKNQQSILDFLEADSFDDIDFFKYSDLQKRLDAGEDIGMSSKELNSKLESARDKHEKFAEHFEAYLQTGKAPSSGLIEAFRNFRNWLTQVYKKIVPHGVVLSKDVTDMFDRMLATEDQITEMEAYYHYDADAKATEKAKDGLQSELFKELKSRTTKKWKAEKTGIESEILEELEESKLYRAEKYIKENKLNEQQVAESLGYREIKQKRELDPTQDSLLVAIAKVGGLDRAEAEGHGVDPANWKGKKNFSNSLVSFQKPVFKKDNSKTLSDLVEELGTQDNGYVFESENDLIYAITEELSGRETYSNKYQPELFEYTEEMEADYYDRKPKRLYGSTSKDGDDIDNVAIRLGYLNGNDMLREIAESKTIAVEASDQANAEMLEIHGDILNDGSLEDIARYEAFNAERGKSLLKELKALSKSKSLGINRQMLDRSAKDKIYNMPISEIRPEQYHRKEVKAGQDFQNYKTEGDQDMMVQAKMDQLINFYLYRAARKAKEDHEKVRARLQKSKNRTYDSGAIDTEYINHHATYLALHDFTKAQNGMLIYDDNGQQVGAQDSLHRLAKWIQSQQETNPDGYTPEFFDPKLQMIVEGHEVELHSYKDMSLYEIKAVEDMAKNLIATGKRNSLDEKFEQAEINKAIGETIRENGGKDKKKYPHGGKKKLKDKIPSTWGLASTIVHIREFDGWLKSKGKDETAGLMYEAVYTPINNAENKLIEMETELIDLIEELITDNYKYFNNKKGKTFGNVSLTNSQRVMFAVYFGSPESRATLLKTGIDNKEMSMAEAQEILDSLSEGEVKIVKAIWQINDNFKDRMFQTERNINGIAPPAVEKLPFVVNGKILEGGYHKINYARHAKDSANREDPMSEARNGVLKSGLTKVKSGAMMQRKGDGGRMLSLDSGSFTKGIKENIQFIAYAETSKEIHKVLKSDDVKEAIIDKWGTSRYTSFINGINGAILGDALQHKGYNDIADIAATARSNAGIAMLMFSARNTAQQFVGTSNLFANNRVNKRSYQKVLSEYAAAPLELERIVSKKSIFMKERMRYVSREAQDLTGSIDQAIDGSKLKKVTKYGFTPQTIIDKVFGYPAWLSIYRDGITEHGDEQRAINHANQMIIDAMGSGRAKDLAPIFTGASEGGNPVAVEAGKQLSFMGTFFAKVGEGYYETAKGDFSSAKKLENVFITLFAASIFSALVVSDGPDEEEGWTEWMFKENLSYLFSSIIPLRDIMNKAIKGYDSKIPLSQAITSAGTLVGSSVEIAKGEEDFDRRFWRNTVRALTPFMPLPGAYQALRFEDGLQDESQNIYEKLVEGKNR